MGAKDSTEDGIEVDGRTAVVAMVDELGWMFSGVALQGCLEDQRDFLARRLVKLVHLASPCNIDCPISRINFINSNLVKYYKTQGSEYSPI